MCMPFRLKLGPLQTLAFLAAFALAIFSQPGAVYAESEATAENLSTPQLINRAFANGEISADERLLMLAYAIYEFESLPERYHSPVGWYGTQYVRELKESVNQVQSASVSAVQREIGRVIGGGVVTQTNCDKNDGPNNTQSIHFNINYDTLLGGLSIDDYNTSLDATYGQEVVNYGWAAPPVCQAPFSPNCPAAPPDNKYPVQIVPLGGSLFGYVTSNPGDGQYAGVVGDNPNTTAVETEARASCMVLNNDFSQFAGFTAQQNLDATTSHEYVHAIQNAYGDAGGTEDAMWFESGASYMEDEVFDTSNSAYQYLWPTTTQCLGQWPNGQAPGGISEYSNFTFFRHVAEHNGGTNTGNAGGGEDVKQAFWENVAQGQDALVAYNNALASKGTQSNNLADAFHKYAATIRFSKSCAGGYVTPYCFEEGAAYVASKGGTTVPSQGTIAASPGSHTGTVLDHYAANFVDLPTTGIYNVFLKNTSANGKLRGSLVCDTGTTLNVTPFPAVANGYQTTTLIGFNGALCTGGAVAVITNENQTSGNPAACTADGYEVSINSAVDEDARMSRSLDSLSFDPTSNPPNASKGTFMLNFNFNYNNNIVFASGGLSQNGVNPAPPLNGVFLRVSTANQATLMNADDNQPGGMGQPGGVGAVKTIPDASLPGGNNLFEAAEVLVVPLTVGVNGSPFQLNFDLYGVEQPQPLVNSADGDVDQEAKAVLIQSFTLTDEDLNRVHDIFIPLWQ